MALLPWDAELPANTPRYTGAPGHVESYFLRANDPARPRALWLKATILAPLEGPPVAETWLIWFDGDANRTFACKQTLPFRAEMFRATPYGASIGVGDWVLAVGDVGAGKGSIRSAQGAAAFDLRWARSESVVAAPLSIFPWRLLREGPFPKSKLLTPEPWLAFSGSVTVPALGSAAGQSETVSLDGWVGMQGHNWGKEHAFEYAWGQCLFPAERGEPAAMVEGFTGRVRIGGKTSPRMSAAVVRRGEREYRFDRVVDFWRQEAHVTPTRWTLRLHGPDAELRLRMDATTRPFACLGYESPDRSLAYCFNSKLAEVLLEVQPRGESAFTCRSAHGGALELLRREPDSRLTVV
jgi:hypothetical protein